MPALERVAETFKHKLGTKSEYDLGEVTRLLIQRYALSIGDNNPLYHDVNFAREQGYADIVAPPNMLASIVEWGSGPEESGIRVDGTPAEDGFLPIEEEIRVMGGGEKMSFYKPTVAGTRITLISELSGAYTKQGRKGPLIFVVFTNTYNDQDGDAVCVCTRTIIAR